MRRCVNFGPKGSDMTRETDTAPLLMQQATEGLWLTTAPSASAGDLAPAGLITDLLIRGIGLLGIGISVVAGIWLHRLASRGAAVGPSPVQYGLAAVAFVSTSLGSGLLLLGRHIHDHIEVSERWRPRWPV
jgi:hypothetical protein